ncbi:MAG: monovalent cation/H(+) antiporter subunit G [Actinomycetota bacterium]
MSVVADLLMIVGGLIAVIAAIGLLRFDTPYARFHAAGKASPIAFLFAALGASLELGLEGAVQLALAVGAMVLTLPVGVHLLFRAVHRTSNPDCLMLDELAPAERQAKGGTSPNADA